MPFVGSDLWKVRQKWGSGPLVWPGITAVVLNEEGKVWMGLRTDTRTWSIVGGYYELGDSAEGCARREVKEELGVEAVEVRMIGVITDPVKTTLKYPNGHEIQSPSHVFMVKVKGSDALGDDEHSAFKWVEVDEAVTAFKGMFGYSATALGMYKAWLASGEFQLA